jgi:probable LLM family oxidoreductase
LHAQRFARIVDVELGIVSFAEVTDPSVSPQQRLRDLIEEIELADQVGLDVYGLGEHHRPDFAVSDPVPVLAAAAARTNDIRLSSAVTVLSSSDPVRVFQSFAELDLLSDGRAEIIAGRGSFTESFPLFGLDLEHYDELFVEKLQLLLALRDNERVTWEGDFRPALHDQPVYPRPVQDPLPIWIGVGGNPQSVIRAGVLGLPIAVAIIGGSPDRFVPLVELYRRAAEEAGQEPQPVAINTHGFVADTEQAAVDAFFPSYQLVMSRLGRERGWPPMTREQFDAMRGPSGSMFLGAPEQLTEKIVRTHELFANTRYLLHPSVGTVDHAAVMRAIELFGTEVAPAVRAELAVTTP